MYSLTKDAQPAYDALLAEWTAGKVQRLWQRDRTLWTNTEGAEAEDRWMGWLETVKKKLKRLAGFIASAYGAEVKVFVDTAPLMEKPLAAAAGIGWRAGSTRSRSRRRCSRCWTPSCSRWAAGACSRARRR